MLEGNWNRFSPLYHLSQKISQAGQYNFIPPNSITQVLRSPTSSFCPHHFLFLLSFISISSWSSSSSSRACLWFSSFLFVNWICFSSFGSGCVCVSSAPHTHTHPDAHRNFGRGVGRLGYDVAISEDNFQQYTQSWADRETKVYYTHTQDRWSDCAVLLISPSQRKEERKERESREL